MTDVKKLITDNIDVWTSAIKKRNATGRGSNKKIELTGIKKLRELILELAVRGKLVPQDASDEPASVLLRKIAKEKAQLIADKKIKKQKALPAITDKEKPFNIPKNWLFQRFGEVMYNRDGERKPVSADERRGIQGQYDYYGASGVIDQVNDFLFDKTLLLIGEDGANLISRSTPIAFLAHGKYWVNNHAHVLDGITTQFLEFIALHINAISLEDYITGTAQPKMNQAKMNSIVIAIPPEAEQHRIVAKVDELMALCDQLEQQTEQSLSAHQTLVEVLLASLTSGTSTDVDNKEDLTATDGGNEGNAGAISFQTSWQRIAEHFDVLFTTEASIEQLKQTILQLAVMGKLVPQNPNDEPASVLLEKIAEEKAQLTADKKIKKQKPLPVITDEEKPFELPTGWKFERLEKMTSLITKGSSPKWQGVSYTEDPTDVLFVTSENVGAFELKLDKRKFVEKKFNDVEPRSILQKHDFLMNIVGASIGRTATYNIDELANINQAVCLIRTFPSLVCNKYFLTFFNSNICISYMYDKQVDNARPNLSMANIAKFVIPIPPLAEQYRIVAKVDELMALCDQLKARLSDAQTTQLHLADTVVENALGIH